MVAPQRRGRRARENSPPTRGPMFEVPKSEAAGASPETEAKVEIEIVDFSPDVAKAILAAQAKVKKLVKENQNEYAGYMFASIDQFYEQAAPIINKQGLTVDAFQYEAVPLGIDYMIFKFIGVLMFRTGKRYRVATVSVPMPIAGPQTSGSATSYAEKILMRAIFKIPTGEEDADATPKGRPTFSGQQNNVRQFPRRDQRNAPPSGDQSWREEMTPQDAVPPAPPPPPPPPVRKVPPIDVFEIPHHVAAAKTYQVLRALWDDQNLDRLEQSDIKSFRWLRKLFNDRMAALKPKESA